MHIVGIHSGKELGELVREERKKNALKQTECASLCDVGVRFLSEL